MNMIIQIRERKVGTRSTVVMVSLEEYDDPDDWLVDKKFHKAPGSDEIWEAENIVLQINNKGVFEYIRFDNPVATVHEEVCSISVTITPV